MNDIELSKRLRTAAKFVQPGDRLADIGSDHAYLPSELAEKGMITFAIAGEVAEGPLERSTKEVIRRGLSHIIEVRKGDGLEVINLEDNITTITICGMGGSLIRNILEEGKQAGKLLNITRLILQPNVGEEKVRQWLDENRFSITNEEILEENNKIYEVIVADRNILKNKPEYNQTDYQFGVYLKTECSPLYFRKWKSELKKNRYVLDQLKLSTQDTSKQQEEKKQTISMIKERLKACE